MVPALVGMVGLGATLLTRFGTQIYPASRAAIVPGEPVSPIQVEQEDSEYERHDESDLDESEPSVRGTVVGEEPDDAGDEPA